MTGVDRKIVWVIVGVGLLGLVLVIVPMVLVVHSFAMGHFHIPGLPFAQVQRQVVIPTGKTAYCETNLRAERLRFYRRTEVEAYRKVGRHNKAWDAAALSYLEDCCRASAGMPDAQRPEALVRKGKALMGAKCTDPMVEFCYGLNLSRVEDAKRYLVRAINGFKSCRYPYARTLFAPTDLAEIDHDELASIAHHSSPEFSREQIAMKSLALQWLGASLRDGSYTGSERRLFFDRLDDHINEVFSTREVLAQLHAIPGADPYIVNVLEGEEEIDAAWKAMGDGGMLRAALGLQVYKKHLAVARQKLTMAWKQHPELPEAPDNMITVAMAWEANSGETAYTWFNRAVSAQMDYAPAYEDLLQALYPNAGGSYDEMYRVGLACLATKRFDTIVPGQFFVTLCNISDDANGSLEYWHRPETYQHLQTMFAGYLQTEPKHRNWHNSSYAAASFLCGHYADAQRLLDALGSKAEEWPFRHYAHCTLATARVRIRMHQPPDLTQPIPARSIGKP